MSYDIIAIPKFKKEIKKLAKKYPTLKIDFAGFLRSLEADPKQRTSLGKNCYKIRLAITTKGKGKSGSARVINYQCRSIRNYCLFALHLR